MSSKDSSNIIFYLVGLIIVLLLIIVITICMPRNNDSYQNKTKRLNKTIINYPYFHKNNIDNYIKDYINIEDNTKYNKIEYKINYVDNYISILFTKYNDDKPSNYDYLIFNKDGNIETINSIISDEKILKEKIRIYLEKNNITINDFENAKFDYLLDKNEINTIITSNENSTISFTTANINYHEIEEILKISFEVDKNYVKELTTTTTTTTKITKNDSEKDSDKIISFTFDDGPSKYTKEIMDVLEEYNASATFFEVGYNIKNYKSIVKEVVDRGFEVGNHTTDHSNLNKLSKQKVISKINDNNEIFKQITGKDFTLLRPPYGNCKSSVRELINVPIIIWSVDSRDWESRNTEKIVELVKQETKPGDIILFHDLYPTTLEAIKILVPYFYENGYKIVGVSELFKTQGIELKAGNKYYKLNSD